MGLVIFLILLGIILLLVEILLIPGVGLAGILGIASICGSSYYAFAYLSPWTGAVVTFINVVLLSVLFFFVLRSKTWRKLELNTVIDSKPEDRTVEIGDKGVTVTCLGPMGTARFNDFSCEVTALEGMIAPGVTVEVAHIEKNKIYVKPVMPDEAF